MLDSIEIFNESLVNHLYFASTIRSFCITIGLTFFKNNQDYIDRAILLGYRATEIINKSLSLMDKTLAKIILDNDVYVTPYTKELDLLTEKLFNVDLVISIDKDLNILKNREVVNYDNLDQINELNKESLILINDFKNFCSEIKTKLDNQELFSYTYPDFFNYMYDEISVYGRDIERIISKKDYTKFYLEEYVYYFNEILRESALYIRGYLDTSDGDIFDMSSYFINAFSNLSEKYLKKKYDNLNIETIKLVTSYKAFIIQIIEKLLKAKTYFITPPVTLDNFLTNVNVYLYLLEFVNKKS